MNTYLPVLHNLVDVFWILVNILVNSLEFLFLILSKIEPLYKKLSWEFSEISKNSMSLRTQEL